MSKEILERIFEPFFTTKGLAKGTGLGLPMVYGIVKSHSGFIECASEPNRGATFKIFFPAIEQDVGSETPRDMEMPAAGRETILVVDDEDSVRDLGRDTLTTFGYTVLSAASGEQALELYRKKRDRVDLVILDLIMPGMSGRQCLEELLKLNPRVKVLVASGFSNIGPMRETIAAGARSFIAKPYEVKHLLQVVRQVLDQD
jgi:CheY-like chemotaxis protein